MGRRLDLAGKQFGRLVAVSEACKRNGVMYWNCECSCGSKVVKQGSALNKGRVRSCGCETKERLAKQGTHNHCRRGAVSSTWYSWKSMHDRCKPNHKSKAYYFDAGVTVCERWLSFDNFLEDMGERPAGTTLDRIDVGTGYCKENCRWATLSQQQTNKTSTKRFTHNGVTKTLTEWSKDPVCRVAYSTLHKRVIVYGFDFEKSLTTKSGEWK